MGNKKKTSLTIQYSSEGYAGDISGTYGNTKRDQFMLYLYGIDQVIWGKKNIIGNVRLPAHGGPWRIARRRYLSRLHALRRQRTSIVTAEKFQSTSDTVSQIHLIEPQK